MRRGQAGWVGWERMGGVNYTYFGRYSCVRGRRGRRGPGGGGNKAPLKFVRTLARTHRSILIITYMLDDYSSTS